MSVITEFRNLIKTQHKIKHNNTMNYYKSKLLTYKEESGKDRRFTLYDKYLYEQKTVKRRVQDEITSVSLKMRNRIVVFNTPTIDPKLNQLEENNTIDKLLLQLKYQYSEFQTYSNKIRKFNYRDNGKLIDLKFDSVSRFELTKKCNLHRHNIDILDSFDDLLRYIKRVLLKRNNLLIGRIELRIDYELVNKLISTKQVIRINRKDEILEFKYDKRLKGYIILNSKKSNGNFVYIKPIKDLTEDKNHLTKYLFKYLLKSSNESSFDSMVFKNLGFKQKQYSHNFFTKKLKKNDLEKLSSIVYNLKKRHKNSYLDILPNEGIMFYLSELFNEDIVRYEDDKLILNTDNTILYSPKSFYVIEIDKDIDFWKKKKQILQLKFKINNILSDREEVELHNLDVCEQREKDYVKKHLEIEELEDTSSNRKKYEFLFRKDIVKNTFDMGYFQTNEENYKWEKESTYKQEKNEKLIFHKSQNKKLDKLLNEHYENHMDKTFSNSKKGYTEEEKKVFDEQYERYIKNKKSKFVKSRKEENKVIDKELEEYYWKLDQMAKGENSANYDFIEVYEDF